MLFNDLFDSFSTYAVGTCARLNCINHARGSFTAHPGGICGCRSNDRACNERCTCRADCDNPKKTATAGTLATDGSDGRDDEQYQRAADFNNAAPKK